MRMQLLTALLLGVAMSPPRASAADDVNKKIRVLIIDGMNNHDWARNTRILKAIMEKSDGFTVDVSTSPPTTQPTEAQAWEHWRPKFSEYDCIFLNFNGGYQPKTGVH